MAKELKDLTKRSENYSQWYNDLVVKADLAEQSAVRGCMVIKPYGYAIWEKMQQELDRMFKETGHQNAYFPLLIPKSFLSREADHVEGFAKECAVVTHYRLKNAEDGSGVVVDPAARLEEELIIRPTSETIIWNTYRNWIHSYRDLPILINQWANVMRWEMRTRMFLRTAEFLWQEGHTAHATEQEAWEEARRMLDIYAEFAEKYMAVPVIKGVKSANERFAGAIETLCIEAMMQDGKALQAGTSHFLGQNFAKSAGISFVNNEGKPEFAYTTSWGVSTRLIGGVIMTHADDEGMVVPPRIAPYQVILVPVIKNEADREAVMNYIEQIKNRIKSLTPFGEKIRVKIDNRNKLSVDKFWDWTRKGAPIICEIGMRDVEGDKVMVKERLKLGTPEGKQIMAVEQFAEDVAGRLEAVQKEMFNRAQTRLENNIRTDIVTHDAFEKYFANANRFLKEGDGNAVAFVRGKWSGDPNSEELLKALKITIRCIPFDQSGTKGECLLTGAKDAEIDVIYARSY